MKKQKTVVVLVSDQTIPNVMFLKWHFRNNLATAGTNIVFVSTKKMKEKKISENILSALSYAENCINKKEVLIVEENDLKAIFQALEKGYANYCEQTSEWFVNFTGGTKPMSIATYSFFLGKPGVNLFYQPIGDHLRQLRPEEKIISSDDIVTLDEYFNAYGISCKYDNSCVRDWGYNSCVYDTVIENTKDFRKQMLVIQNDNYFKEKMHDKKFLDFENLKAERIVALKEKENVEIFIDELVEGIKQFGFNPQHLESSQQRYITGGWFEEFVYQKIKEEMHLPDDKIALNVRLKKGNGTSNELDVVYLDSKNQLHVIECKSFIDENTQKDLLANTLYKIQAVKSELGLFVKSHLYTMSEITKDAPIRRAESFDIEIVDGEKLR